MNYETPRGRRRRKMRQFAKHAVIGFAMFLAMMAFLAGVLPIIIDKAEQEAKWREDRRCRIYDICNPSGGQ